VKTALLHAGVSPDPKGSLSAAIPAKASISKCRRQLKAWMELGKHGLCKYRPTLSVSMVQLQLQQHTIFQGSWRSKATLLMCFNVFSFCQYARSATKIKLLWWNTLLIYSLWWNTVLIHSPKTRMCKHAKSLSLHAGKKTGYFI